MAMLESVCPASWRAEPAGGDGAHHGQAIKFVSVKGLQGRWQIELVRVIDRAIKGETERVARVVKMAGIRLD
jgi:hypothetical protein